MGKFIGFLITLIGTIGLFFIISLLFAFPVMWLWNWLMPTIFMLPKISVLQSVGLNLLAGFLIKSNSNSKE